MTTYEYITIFTSIIFGLATVNMLKVIAAMIHSEVKVDFYAVHSIWVVNIISVIFLIWWDNLALNAGLGIDFFHYLDLTGYAVILFIMSALLLPYKDKEYINFSKLFNQNKKKFYLSGIILFLFDFFDLVLKHQSTPQTLGSPHLIFDTIIVASLLYALISSTKWSDWLTSITFLVGVITWFFFQAFGFSW